MSPCGTLAPVRDELREALELEQRWRIHPELARRLALTMVAFRSRTATGIAVISGYRSSAEQAALRRQGRPAARDDLSTHRVCPATGADVQINGLADKNRKWIFGELAMLNGLRWGGGSPRDEEGFPSDWNHVDLGPRAPP